MLQILQNIRNGEISLKEVPPPMNRHNGIIVRTAFSLISAGTEKSIIELAGKSIIGKARSRPDLVRQIVTKARKEGWVNTYNNINSKMEKPAALGYSAAGIVEETGRDTSGFIRGDRVAIAGAGYANHAEINYVPENLAVKIPENVSFEEAAYTTVASIALQGIRLAKPQLGDSAMVIGLGLVGLLLVQMLKANGLRVIGVDHNPFKIDTAMRLGMDEYVQIPEEYVSDKTIQFTGGYGVDNVFITASTESDQPVIMAGEAARRKAKIIIVGMVGMKIPRDIYYKKELELKVSMSYGPGRYDYSYEEGGIDYPYEFVRWTEKRNMQAVLQLMAENKLNTKILTTHEYTIDKSLSAYNLIRSGNDKYIGIILKYDIHKVQSDTVINTRMKNFPPLSKFQPGDQKEICRAGFIGAGNYAAQHLLPYLKEDNSVILTGLATATGNNSLQKSERFGFGFSSSDAGKIIEDKNTDSVFIVTRHSTHAEYVIRAVSAGKNVFVEKPIAVSNEQLADIVAGTERTEKPAAIMVGLNRRFSKMIRMLNDHFQPGSPKQMIYRVNAGEIQTDSWIHDRNEGAGMLIGEMCHFIDTMIFMCGGMPETVFARSMPLNSSKVKNDDNLSVIVTFSNGSTGTLIYNTIGTRSYSKERIEVYGDNRAAAMDDFRTLELYGAKKIKKYRSSNQDKGQREMLREVIAAFRKGTSPIPFEEIIRGMETVFTIKESLRQNKMLYVSSVPEEKNIRVPA